MNQPIRSRHKNGNKIDSKTNYVQETISNTKQNQHEDQLNKDIPKNYSEMSRKQLVEQCKKRKLGFGGNIDELTKCLLNNDKAKDVAAAEKEKSSPTEICNGSENF